MGYLFLGVFKLVLLTKLNCCFKYFFLRKFLLQVDSRVEIRCKKQESIPAERVAPASAATTRCQYGWGWVCSGHGYVEGGSPFHVTYPMMHVVCGIT